MQINKLRQWDIISGVELKILISIPFLPLFDPYSTSLHTLFTLYSGSLSHSSFKEIATHKNKPKLTTALTSGKKRTHGGYAYFTTGKLPEHRKYIEAYLTAARMNLIEDLGPTEEDLTAAQIIIIDRVVSKLGVIRCIEEHIKENAVMVGHNLAPALRASYLAYNNSVRLDLRELGIDKKQGDSVPDIQDYIKEKYGDKK